MSRQRDKGTRGEREVRDFLRPVFPDVERTGSDHSTLWGPHDLRETGAWGVEVKKWKDWNAAIRAGWPQVERNAAWTDNARPMLIVLRHRKPTGRGLVVCRLEDMRREIRDAERYRRQ